MLPRVVLGKTNCTRIVNCKAGVGTLTCSAAITLMVGAAVMFLWMAASVRPALRRSPDALPFCSSAVRALMQDQRSKFAAEYSIAALWLMSLPLMPGCFPAFWLAPVPNHYELPLRPSLACIWRVLRIGIGWSSVLYLACGVLVHLQEPKLEGEDREFAGMVVCAAVHLASAIITSPSSRRSLHAHLNRLASPPEEWCAALIAGLISRRGSAKHVLMLASESFRVIPFESLCAKDFERGPALGIDGSDSLASRSVAAELGQADAFISHSWHDSECSSGSHMLADRPLADAHRLPTCGLFCDQHSHIL
eukprot:5833964-Prymnesium_polylepis.1